MKTLDVVMVEDQVSDVELALRVLKRAGIECNSRRVDTEIHLRRELALRLPDIVLSDFSMPAFNGMQALDVVQEVCPDIPFIFLSGTIGEENAIMALKRGATDYVLKSDLSRLAPAVERALDDAKVLAEQRRIQAALAHSELRFRLAASTGDVWDWTVATGAAHISPQWKQRLGYADDEIANTAQAWLDLIEPQDRVAVLEAFAGHIQHRHPYDVEYRARAKDGSYRWSHAKGQAVWDETNRAAYMAGTVVDITERKSAEIKIKRLNRVYAVLSSINSLIVRAQDREDLLRGACQIAVEEGNFPLAWIGLVEHEHEHEQKRVAVATWAGAGNDYIEYIPMGLDAASPKQYGLVGRSVNQKEAVIAQDVQQTPHIVLREQALARGFRSFALLPILTSEAPMGILALYASEIGFFDEAEMRLLGELASDIAFALDHLAKADRLNYLAYYDALTALPNRGLIHDRLTQLLQTIGQTELESGSVAVVWINIDRFKNINATLGRHAGDSVLKQVAHRLLQVLGSSDRLSRTGGDLFAAIVAYRTDPAEVAHMLNEQLLPQLERPFTVENKELYLTFRIGIALYPGDGKDADTLFGNAEAASRSAGAAEGRYKFYAPTMNDRVKGLLTIEGKLHKAFANNEFVLHYQPKADLISGLITGMEGLIRWNDPEAGLVPPSAFIPVLEETGMIVDVGRWILEQARTDFERWHGMGLHPPRIAINVSTVQMRRSDFIHVLEETLRKNSSARAFLDLELTESLFMEDIETNVSRLRAIRELGVRLAIDDFGTGYSSLSYLKRFPLDYLKIDQSFVRDVNSDPDAAAICVAVIDLAHNLKLKVIAEGVETEAQLGYLRRKRCDEIQGYYFCRPLAFEGISDLLRQGSKLKLTQESGDTHKGLLIVDDETSILSAMRRLLRRDGYEIFTASSAKAGLDLLALHDIQVILSDQRMPEMSGTEFLSRARDLYPDTIRIVLSGYTDLESISSAINRGAIYKFLTKPWDDESLRNSVREAFRHHEMAAAHK